MTGREALIDHLQSGATTTCRAWRVERSDGQVFGFTDHDADMEFDGTLFRANTGLTPGMLQLSNGLAVNNTEVMGALCDHSISEVDLLSGRFDGARIVTWLVNWRVPEQRMIRFRGTFGEIQVADGEFRVELRGLTESLENRRGRVIQPSCAANLGDTACKFDLSQPDFSVRTVIKSHSASGEFLIPSLTHLPNGWFAWGRAEVTSGIAMGMTAAVRSDLEKDGFRRIDLLVDFPIAPSEGDEVLLQAGCDKTGTTCREKFSNFLNFRGFPHVPGSDWLASYPIYTQRNDGSSRIK